MLRYPLIALCLSWLIVSSCQLQDGELNPDQILTLQSDSTEILADGASSLTLTATLGEDADPNLPVTFRTDAGTFAGTPRQSESAITVTAALGVASATLISSTTVEDVVNVSAEINGLGAAAATSFNRFTEVSFYRAYPEQMRFTADRLSLSANQLENATLTVELFRQGEGEVSGGSLIQFSAAAVDTSRAEADFPEFEYVDANTLSINVKSLTTEPGQVAITAETEKFDGSLLQKTIVLTFTE